MAKKVWTYRFPPKGPYYTGIRINNAGGYAASTTSAMTTDQTWADGDATEAFNPRDKVFVKQDGKYIELGTISATGATQITCGTTGTSVAVSDNEDLYHEDVGSALYIQMLHSAASSSVALSANTLIDCELVMGELFFTVTTLA